MITEYLETLKKRAQQSGGFSYRERSEQFRPDATAWATLALTIHNAGEVDVQHARSRLAAEQMADGRVAISSDHPEAFWPTSLAILAWHKSPPHRESQQRAVHFLLETTGYHSQQKANAPVAHDTGIKGWPWIADTHSWVEPTALGIIALRVTGNSGHQRVDEARRMLMDRQISSGGWNYGNTGVFGQELHPMAATTGIALAGLEDLASRSEVEVSLKYLKSSIDTLHTPQSLGWGLLGLSAWEERPAEASTLISECLKRQEQFGAYDTQSLSLLLVAWVASEGLIHKIAETNKVHYG